MAVTALKIPTNLFHLLFSFGQERLDDKIPNSGRYLSINNKRKILSDRNTQNPGTWERVRYLAEESKMQFTNELCKLCVHGKDNSKNKKSYVRNERTNFKNVYFKKEVTLSSPF